ncbi:MAG: hypothetical protein Q9163_005079 [Psora crenata]
MMATDDPTLETPTPRADGPDDDDGEEAEALFRQLESYSWSEDVEFQRGLRSILSQSPSPEQAKHLTIRARCFYYARKSGVPIDASAYEAWRAQRHLPGDLTNGTATLALPGPSSGPVVTTAAPSSTVERSTTLPHEPASGSVEPPAPYPNTFSQIVEFISTGQPIPGIKEVPDTVLEGQASQPMVGKRKKPWERDGDGPGEKGSALMVRGAS